MASIYIQYQQDIPARFSTTKGFKIYPNTTKKASKSFVGRSRFFVFWGRGTKFSNLLVLGLRVYSTLGTCDTGADWIDHVGGAVVPKEASEFFRFVKHPSKGNPVAEETGKLEMVLPWNFNIYGCFQK